MAQATWKTQVEAAIHDVGRDLAEMTREAKHFLASLSTTERLVLTGLLMIGLICLLLSQFRKRDGAEHGEGQFAGFLFLFVAAAAGAGWMMAGHTA
jgi:hypothetical protein